MRCLPALLLLAALPVSARVCPVLEFAELEAMRAEELLQIRCEYEQNSDDIMRTIDPKGPLADARFQLSTANHCTQQMNRMDRILSRKYGLTGEADKNMLAIRSRCRAQK